MKRPGCRLSVALLAIVFPATTARAQYFLWGGGGATVQGDILRGEGVFLRGAGLYNLNTAQANSINTDTFIRFNEYIYNVAKNENRENAEHRAQVRARNKANYEAILKRIQENPDDHDVMTGDALNSVLKQLLEPQMFSNLRLASQVPIPVDTVRCIPFTFAQQNRTFSMQRLTAKGKWPVGLRGPQFAAERQAYEQAFDAALDQVLEGKGKLQRPAILKVEGVLAELREKLPRVIPANDKDQIYKEARQFLDRLDVTKELFKSAKAEMILGEIDRYSGTNVYDLIKFMQAYNLGFGVPDIGSERAMYQQLFASLQLQRDEATGRSK
jgi:hypothetical protein